MKILRLFVVLAVLIPSLPLFAQSTDPPAIEISFYGNENVSNDELLENFKSCAGGAWEKYDERAYDYIAQKCLRALMHSKGFWRAKVVDITSRVRGPIRSVLIVVNEGTRYRIGKIEIEGNKELSRNDILDMLGQRTGDVADGKALQDLVYEKLKEKYGERGYVQYNAEFEPDFVEPRGRDADGVVNMSITIDEGRRFKLRRVGFRGVSEEEEKSLIEQFLLKSGDVFSVPKAQNALKMLNETGRFAPVDMDSRDIEIRTDEKDADIDLVIELERRPHER